MVTIRPIANADCADILRINVGSRPAVAPLERAELDRLLALGDDHRVAVADDGAVVAYMLVFTHDSAYDGEEFRYFGARLQRPFLYIDQVAVDPARKRLSIGGRLYERLLGLARSRQIEWLCCEVNTSPMNAASLEFHHRLGFIAMGNGDTLDGRRVAFLVRKV
jgi:predicted GNAT superfamily acetyltransferase